MRVGKTMGRLTWAAKSTTLPFHLVEEEVLEMGLKGGWNGQ